jgi:hypothetical protein
MANAGEIYHPVSVEGAVAVAVGREQKTRHLLGVLLLLLAVAAVAAAAAAAAAAAEVVVVVTVRARSYGQ